MRKIAGKKGEAKILENIFVHYSNIVDPPPKKSIKNGVWVKCKVTKDEGHANFKAVDIKIVPKPEATSTGNGHAKAAAPVPNFTRGRGGRGGGRHGRGRGRGSGLSFNAEVHLMWTVDSWTLLLDD